MATGRIPTTANSPLTAKGDLFTFSTGSAKLAVGADGTTLVADSSESTGLRWTENYAAGKNKIINGNFSINQRSFSSTTTSSDFGFDRWKYVYVTGTVTYSSQAFTAGAAPVAGYEASNFARVATTGQSASNAYSRFQQSIEDVRTFAGQTVTLSFWAKADAGTPKVFGYFGQGFGTGGSSFVDVYASAVTISTSWARYSITIAIPSISGKTVGTGSSLLMALWTSAGSGVATIGSAIGIQNAAIDFWGVQVEAGSTATAFQTATGTLQGELAACQRYYNRFSATSNRTRIGGVGAFASTTVAYTVIPFETRMRTAVTAVEYGGTLGLYDFNTEITVTTLAIVGNSSGVDTATIQANVASGGTQYRPVQLEAFADANAYIAFSAEL
jgi:hypothetical protein